MTNRQAQRDAQRDRRREERQRARREIRQTRVPAPAAVASAKGPDSQKPSFPWAWAVAGIIVAIVAVVGGFFLYKTSTAPLPGQKFDSQGNNHINPGDSHPLYNSNPPTSGWHLPTWPQRGVYTAALPEEYQLHFQEHAGVVIHYNPDKIPADQLTQLTDIAKSELNKGQGLVLMVPDPNIPQAIALTSWQHLESFDTVNGNKSKIEDFIERLQCSYDPEGVCGPPHGNSYQATPAPAGVPTTIAAPIPNGIPQGNVAPGQVPETPAASTPTP